MKAKAPNKNLRALLKKKPARKAHLHVVSNVPATPDVPLLTPEVQLYRVVNPEDYGLREEPRPRVPWWQFWKW